MDFTINLDPAMLGGAGIVFLVGFGIVFLVLILLILILSIQAKIFQALSGKKPEKKAAPKPAPAPVAAPVPAPAPVQSNVEDEDEIAAVIAAVLAMYDGGNGGLVVRSVRRVGVNTPAWGNSGRQDYMATRY